MPFLFAGQIPRMPSPECLAGTKDLVQQMPLDPKAEVPRLPLGTPSPIQEALCSFKKSKVFFSQPSIKPCSGCWMVSVKKRRDTHPSDLQLSFRAFHVTYTESINLGQPSGSISWAPHSHTSCSLFTLHLALCGSLRIEEKS